MSLIVSEIYEALIATGTSTEKAQAAAGAVPLSKDLATKEDLRKLERDPAVLKFGYGTATLVLLVKIAFFP